MKQLLLVFIGLIAFSTSYGECRIDTIHFYTVSVNGSGKTLIGRHINSFDAKDSLTSKLEQLWQNNAWVNNKLTTQTFNASGIKLTEIKQDYNTNTSGWDNVMKIENVLSGNKVTENIEWLWSTSINDWYENKKWSYSYANQQTKPSTVIYLEQSINKTQTYYTYDANMNVTERIIQTWSNNAWVNNNRWTYTYDASNRVTSETPEYWNSVQWQPSAQKITYSYNASGQLTLTTYLSYNNQQYEAVVKIGNTWGNDGITQVLREQYYGPGIGWKGVYREQWAYNQGLLIRKVFQSLNNQTEQYDDTGKEEYAYGTNNLVSIITKLEWVAQGPGGFFRPTDQQQFSYNSNNKLTIKTLLVRNQVGNLEPTNEWVYEYNATDDLIAYEVKSNFNGTVFVVRNREEYSCGQRQTVGVASIEESKLNVYPNPATSKIMVETAWDNANISITDLLGKQVYFLKNASSKTVVETSSFSNGIYFVQIESNAKKTTQRLVINK
jgi:hypothetical protein